MSYKQIPVFVYLLQIGNGSWLYVWMLDAIMGFYFCITNTLMKEATWISLDSRIDKLDGICSTTMLFYMLLVS